MQKGQTKVALVTEFLPLLGVYWVEFFASVRVSPASVDLEFQRFDSGRALLHSIIIENMNKPSTQSASSRGRSAVVLENVKAVPSFCTSRSCFSDTQRLQIDQNHVVNFGIL